MDDQAKRVAELKVFLATKLEDLTKMITRLTELEHLIATAKHLEGPNAVLASDKERVRDAKLETIEARDELAGILAKLSKWEKLLQPLGEQCGEGETCVYCEDLDVSVCLMCGRRRPPK